MNAQGLDGVLIFKVEDMYWLTGYDSDGFSIIGCMFIGTEGKLTHLARPADLSNASYSSICEDVITASNSHKVDAVQSILRPGTTVGEIYDTYQTTLEENGKKDSVLTVCGYTMGAAWPSTWMEQPLIHKGNPVVLEKKHALFYTHDTE
jgi:Xaa-Pro aminopeptidase